jgi:hypothetical protein
MGLIYPEIVCSFNLRYVPIEKMNYWLLRTQEVLERVERWTRGGLHFIVISGIFSLLKYYTSITHQEGGTYR